MNNGWYKVTWPDGRSKILNIERNNTTEGHVSMLIHVEHCLVEEVVVLTKTELKDMLNAEALRHYNP